MKSNPYQIDLGFLGRPHGLKGEFNVTWSANPGTPILFEKKSGEQVIIKIKNYRTIHQGGLVSFEGIDDRTEAEKWVGVALSVKKEDLLSGNNKNDNNSKEIHLFELLGFKIYDHASLIGEITGFSSNGGQDLMKISTPDGYFLIPLVQQFILEIQWDQHQILMNLPEGLLSKDFLWPHNEQK